MGILQGVEAESCALESTASRFQGVEVRSFMM